MAATQFNAPIDRICYINPALEKDMVPGKQVKQIDVWYSPSDRPVQLAKYLPRHIWGEMGSTGYVGEDLRFTNFNKEDMAAARLKQALPLPLSFPPSRCVALSTAFNSS